LDDVYASRFNDMEHEAKVQAWRAVVDYLERWIDPSQPVLDIGCDRGYFINQVNAVERWGLDLRDVGKDMPGVRFVQSDGREPNLPRRHFGTIFLSNFLEHLPSRDAVVTQLALARDLITPDGRLIVLQPNIRYVGAAYWDFIDHHVALTEHSLVEAGGLAGFRTEVLVPRFLPYTTKSNWPVNAALTRWYLRIPIAWRLIGKQTLWIARPA
jgi:hypothetical protein